MKFNKQKVKGQLQCAIITILVFGTITQDQEERLGSYLTWSDPNLECPASKTGLIPMASCGAELKVSAKSTFLKKFGALQHRCLKHSSAYLYRSLLCMSLDRYARLISENVYNRDAVILVCQF